jgi:putative hydrolases of HD superfamily
MIVQADEYERAQPGKDLEDFFASTQGIFKHPQVAAWDQALRAQRDARLGQDQDQDQGDVDETALGGK